MSERTKKKYLIELGETIASLYKELDRAPTLSEIAVRMEEHYHHKHISEEFILDLVK